MRERVQTRAAEQFGDEGVGRQVALRDGAGGAGGLHLVADRLQRRAVGQQQ